MASVVTPVGVQSGDVAIGYTLTDAASDPCNILAEYSPDGGVTWYAATGGPTTGLTSSPGGTSQTFVWASSSDLGSVYDSDVEFRITPTDAVTAAVGTPSADGGLHGEQRGTRGVGGHARRRSEWGRGDRLTLTDAASDPCNILAEYSPDSGATWYAAMEAHNGRRDNGATGLTSSPGGTSQTFCGTAAATWGASPIRRGVRITPTDAVTAAVGTPSARRRPSR